ncbi:putative glycerol-3-phosphate acyltransferase 2 [Acorus gramineus]|uniref:Glycerol-3-phosphate acyltransferase 2 n=1 Tax=Acorus gramineus TaxID=55184 RepID=A0AAV9BYS0_ACOGR|nr:putative glycerol-3-phosphate acyltransferase 2 [Acorus gramineus]
MLSPPTPTFFHGGRESHTIASSFEESLLLSHSHFPYFMLLALEAGGPLRSLLLLFASPIVRSLEFLGHGTLALRLMIFVSMVGLNVADIKAVARATLPRFYYENLGERTYRAFSACGGKRYVVASTPSIMVEPFLREYLGVDLVVATGIRTFRGYCLGLVDSRGVVDGESGLEALRLATDGEMVEVGLGGSGGGAREHQPFMLLCRERYVVPSEDKGPPLQRDHRPKPLIFHDGRLVALPTPSDAMAVFLWAPVGLLLAVVRLLVGRILPYNMGLMAAALTGMNIRARFRGTCHHTCEARGTMYVCAHRTLMDPVIVSATLQRRVTAVTYSLSRVSEALSPILTVRLTRDRLLDGERMKHTLARGQDLVVCPEGTTCREPYLLRFSPLFAEVAGDVVPVAIDARGSMFYGTTVRGHKGLDSIFFLMNPWPSYTVEFLDRLVDVGGRVERGEVPSCEVANRVQGEIGRALGFAGMNLTRRDKYRVLAGNDGCAS